jgi:hypothetical protein
VLAYLALGTAAAQCVVHNPGGNKINVNRPREADVPGPGFSPVRYLNHALQDWLCFDAGYRSRLEGFTNGNFQPGNSDTYVLTRFRIGTLVKARSWLEVYGELQDSTAFWKDQPKAPPYQSTWDLRRGYVDLGTIEVSPVSFRIGRQDLNFGDGRILGTSYWRNASRGYDSVMMVVRWKDLYINSFAAAPVIAGANGLSHHQQGNNLHGIYSTWRNLIPGTDLEPYVLWRLTPGIRTEAGPAAKMDEKTYGLRWAGTRSWFDFTSEAVVQSGHIGSDRIRSLAWAGVAGYTFDKHRTRPRLFAEFDYASGDSDPRDGRHGTFDQIYPNIHGHNGLADQVAWQNLKQFRAGARISLRRNWTLAGTFNDWWLANPKDAFYNSSGTIVARDPRGLSGTHVGEEYDLESIFRVNRLLEFGTGIGRILPGGFLARTNHGRSYTYPYVMLNYNFY